MTFVFARTEANELDHDPRKLKIDLRRTVGFDGIPRGMSRYICERYGGGGHPRVAAISVLVDQRGQAKRSAAEVVEELKALGQRNRSPTDAV